MSPSPINTLKRLRIDKDLSFILEKIASSGHEAYLVGGCLRNYLLKRPVVDWDIATSAPPQRILGLFKKALPLGIAHGTLTVVHNKTHFEITSFRSRRQSRPGKNIEEDLAHRDFTINALAYDPFARQLVDPFQGEKDLGKGIIRAVDDPVQRFREDPLRTIRCIRIAVELGFRIHPGTLKAIRFFSEKTESLPAERVRNEILKILQSERCVEGMNLLRKTGLLAVFIPELLRGYRMKQREKFHAYDVYRHSLLTAGLLPPDPILRLAGLLHDIGKPSTRKKIRGEFRFIGHEEAGAKIADALLRRMKFSNAQRVRVAHLVKHHAFSYEGKWKDAAVKRLARRLGEERLEDFFLLFEADKRAAGKDGIDLSPIKNLKRRIQKLQKRGDAMGISGLAVDGRDVMAALGIGPGKKVGKALNLLLRIVLEYPEKNTPRTLRDILSSLLSVKAHVKP